LPARRPVEMAICANPELADLDRQITGVNSKLVRAAQSPQQRQALKREHDEFLARRNAEFGKPGYDLKQLMGDRLQHLLAADGNERIGRKRAPLFPETDHAQAIGSNHGPKRDDNSPSRFGAAIGSTRAASIEKALASEAGGGHVRLTQCRAATFDNAFFAAGSLARLRFCRCVGRIGRGAGQQPWVLGRRRSQRS
jgi:hypothetical protein